MMWKVHVLSDWWRVVFSCLWLSAGISCSVFFIRTNHILESGSEICVGTLASILQDCALCSLFHLTAGPTVFFPLLIFGLPSWGAQVSNEAPKKPFLGAFLVWLLLIKFCDFTWGLGIWLGVQSPQVSLLDADTMFSLLSNILLYSWTFV